MSTLVGAELEAVRVFTERAAAELIRSGFPRVPAGVLMALTGSRQGRLSAAELRAVLQVSAAAISSAVGYLDQIGMITISTVPGTRRHSYFVGEDPWFTRIAATDTYRRSADAIRTAVLELPPASAGARRAGEMADFLTFCADRVPDLVQEWLAARSGNAD
ncbi:MarR family transcriptional regulator [Nakamurella sp. A5-74]|uniref:MarR family transcriptional regulator n=1 Tax=Nakamurella sp. A5-74 TaxID=3158264 RepID=A0AAU8DKN1_9ACTN